MKTIKLTRADFTERNDRIEYSGSLDFTNRVDANLEIEGQFVAWFPKLLISGPINTEGPINAEGITAFLSIVCKLELTANRVFAGVLPWRDATGSDCEIRCRKFNGVVKYGTLVETGLPNEQPSLSGQKVIVTVGDKTYTATID